MTEIPLPRTLKKGMAGIDVTAVQRALYFRTTPPIRKYKAFGYFGDPMTAQIKELQRRRGIPQSGVYGPVTHECAVNGTMVDGRQIGKNIFDAYGAFLMQKQEEHLHPSKTRRDLIVEAAYTGYRNRYYIHYAGPGTSHIPERMAWLQMGTRPPAYPRYVDCSSFAEWCYWVSGAPSPSGHYSWGTTYTQLPNGRRISYSQLQRGDLIFYGWGSPSHVTIFVGSGRVISHGMEAGPLLLNYNYRSDILAYCTYPGVDTRVS